MQTALGVAHWVARPHRPGKRKRTALVANHKRDGERSAFKKSVKSKAEMRLEPGQCGVEEFIQSIGVTSYDGAVFYGITADRDAVPDADTLGQCVLESLEELRDSASASRPRAPRGRKR